MRRAIIPVLALALAPMFGGTTTATYAQSTNPDDDDDDDDDAGQGDDDDDVPDPDEPANDPPSDPGDDDEPAGDDGKGDEGAGGDGNDSDDGNKGPGTPDDDGEDDGDDDATGPAGGTGTDDDDNDGDDKDDDRAAAAPGGSSGGKDDDDDDGGEGAGSAPQDRDSGDRDDDDAGNGTSERSDDDGAETSWATGGGDEDEGERVKLDERDGVETDRQGFRYRRNEFVALDLDQRDIARLRARGYQVVRSDRLSALSGTVLLLKSPARMRDDDALEEIDTLADPSTLGLNHLFDSSSAQVKRGGRKSLAGRTACGCNIGLIDTGVAAKIATFKHTTVEQRAFNGANVEPKLHGTAIAHLFAGTAPRPGRRTRIVVADIFAGPRGNSGSTYAFVKALDWLAAKGLPVINVSLSGPSNPVVAAAIDRLSKRGHIVVAAAGNDGPAAPPVFPGAYPAVVAVTAVDAGRQVYRYANRGKYIDFAAYGVNVPSIDPRGSFTTATGTSFAAPVIAARLAERMSKADPGNARALLSGLEKSARDLGPAGRDPIYGYGLIDGNPTK